MLGHISPSSLTFVVCNMAHLFSLASEEVSVAVVLDSGGDCVECSFFFCCVISGLDLRVTDGTVYLHIFLKACQCTRCIGGCFPLKSRKNLNK